MIRILAELHSFYVFQIVENLLCCEIVESRHLALHITLHCVRLARTCLPICKTRYFRAFEGISDEGPYRMLVNQLVAGAFVEGVVEGEGRLLDVLGEIHFLPPVI